MFKLALYGLCCGQERRLRPECWGLEVISFVRFACIEADHQTHDAAQVLDSISRLFIS